MSQAAQLGQKGSDHGQYGQTPMASPYGMDSVANANQQQNENTQNVGDYNPVLPQSTLAQGAPKQWYPGMYPSTQPQFGTNPYSPQTFNVQGHPGHNPSTFAAVEPNIANSAMSNQGQFVQRMASGGTGNFKFTDTAKQWNGPVAVNSPSYQSQQTNPADAVFSMKGLGKPDAVSQPNNAGIKGPGVVSVIGQDNPEFMKAMGKGPAQQVAQPEPVNVPQVNPQSQIYKPVYTQYSGIPNVRG